MAQRVQLTATVSENQLGQRLDQALAEMFPDYSRSRIKEWILDQRVLVNGKVCDKPKEKVLGGEQVAINAEIEEEARFEPQDIPLKMKTLLSLINRATWWYILARVTRMARY
jgi:23S rRNA pseudouridine1911/1915/1917 synthase